MTGSGEKDSFIPDRIIHEPVRLQIVSFLAASDKRVAFTELKEKLNLTAGNLSVQLRKLEEAGYVAITKTFRDRKPLTRVSLTPKGLQALQQYLRELEKMIDRLKKDGATRADTGEDEAP